MKIQKYFKIYDKKFTNVGFVTRFKFINSRGICMKNIVFKNNP
jgi:hypothetical protein